MKKILGSIAVAAMFASCSSYSLVNSDVYNGAELSSFHTFRIVTPDEGTMPPGMTSVTYYNIAAAIREQLVERGFVEDPTSPMLVNIGLTVKKEVAYNAFTTPGVWVTTPPVWGTPVPPLGPSRGDDPALVAQEGQETQRPGGGPGNGGPGGSGNGPQNPGAGQPPMPGPVYNNMVPFFMYPRSYYLPGQTQIVPSIYREGVLTMDIVDLQTKTPLYSSSVATILDAGDTQFRNLSGIAQAVKVLFSKFPVPIQN